MQTKTSPRAMTDRRARIYIARAHEQERLIQLNVARSTVCGCQHCGDSDRREELDTLIRISLERVAYLSEQILR